MRTPSISSSSLLRAFSTGVLRSQVQGVRQLAQGNPSIPGTPGSDTAATQHKLVRIVAKPSKVGPVVLALNGLLILLLGVVLFAQSPYWTELQEASAHVTQVASSSTFADPSIAGSDAVASREPRSFDTDPFARVVTREEAPDYAIKILARFADSSLASMMAVMMLLLGAAAGVAKSSVQPVVTGVFGAAFIKFSPYIMGVLFLGAQ